MRRQLPGWFGFVFVPVVVLAIFVPWITSLGVSPGVKVIFVAVLAAFSLVIAYIGYVPGSAKRQGSAVSKLVVARGQPITRNIVTWGFLAGAVVWLFVRPSGAAVIFAVVVAGVLAKAYFGYVRRSVARVRVAAPEVVVPATPLRVGERFSMSYRQGWKRATEVTSIRFELVLRETAQYSTSTAKGGTNTVIKTHNEVEQEFAIAGQRFAPGQEIYKTCMFRIPENGMHTFTADNNRIEWYVMARVEMGGWPDYRWERELRVLPELQA